MMAYPSAGTCRPAITCLLAMAMAGSAAAAATPEDGPAPAETAAPAPRPKEVIAIPTPLPLPGQLKPPVAASPAANSGDPRDRVVRANAAARVQPDRASWLNAIQQYPYTDGALYQVYTAPGQVTDLALQEGEELAGSGPVATGDTVRWVIGDTVSGTGTGKRVHILVKPTRDDIATNMVINTARRTYHLELHATPATYMAAVSWTYPQDQLIALRAASAEAAKAAPVASGVDPAALNFRYSIDGDRPAWRPVRAFDDGRQTFVEFPEHVSTSDMPPLFLLGADGKDELVNYRVQGRYMVVDRLFSVAELRLGAKKGLQRVRIAAGDDHHPMRGRP